MRGDFIKVLDKVIIRPASSFAFGGRLGYIQEIVAGDLLPIKIQISDNGTIYGFAPNELITKDEYDAWMARSPNERRCCMCGIDTTEQYDTICENCKYPTYVFEGVSDGRLKGRRR
jgi:hypothetical protein